MILLLLFRLSFLLLLEENVLFELVIDVIICVHGFIADHFEVTSVEGAEFVRSIVGHQHILELLHKGYYQE